MSKEKHAESTNKHPDIHHQLFQQMNKAQAIKTLIAVPCMETVPTDFLQCFVMLQRVGDTRFGITKCSMIHDARNTFAMKAIQGDYDRVLWLDSDMVFQPDLMGRLSQDMDDMNADYVSALAFKRVSPTEPVIYNSLHELKDVPGMYGVTVYKDYPKDTAFPIQASGFGAVMTSTKLLKQVWDKYGPPFSYVANLGEDMSFCWKVNQLGIPMYCDSRIKVGHIGQMVFDEELWKKEKCVK